MLASPATVSPADTETATGRNSGSTSASAAAGNRAPLLSTSARKAGPSPGRGPMPVTLRNTATRVGRPASSAIDTQVRGRRTSLRSSTSSIGSTPAGEGQEHVLQGGAHHDQLADADAALHQVLVERLGAGAVELHHQAAGARLAKIDPGEPRGQFGRAVEVWGGDLDPAGGDEQGLNAVLGDQAALVDDGGASADELHLGQQVAGEEHGGTAGDQLGQQVADLAHALRVE